MLLNANFMNIAMQRISGIEGNSIHPVVITKQTELNDGVLGCWTSHVNCWRKVIEDGVDTAVVLEDDADWDISLKDQLYLLSRAIKDNGSPLRQMNESSQSGRVRSDAPYGKLTSHMIRPKTHDFSTLSIIDLHWFGRYWDWINDANCCLSSQAWIGIYYMSDTASIAAILARCRLGADTETRPFFL